MSGIHPAKMLLLTEGTKRPRLVRMQSFQLDELLGSDRESLGIDKGAAYFRNQDSETVVNSVASGLLDRELRGPVVFVSFEEIPDRWHRLTSRGLQL